MGRGTANIAGLAALAGAAYMYDKKKRESEGTGSTRPADSVASDDAPRRKITDYMAKAPLDGTEMYPSNVMGGASQSTSRSSGSSAPAPAPAADTETVTPSSRVTPGGNAKRTEGNQPMPSLRAVEARVASNKTDAMRNASRANVAAANRMKAMAANPEAQALEESHPEQFMTPGGGFKTAANMARNLANRGGKEVAEYSVPLLRGAASEAETVAPRLGGPTKQLTGPSKTDLMARDRAARASSRQEEMLRENARRSGLDPDNINPAVANKVRENMGGADFSLGIKKGGAVKAKRMASGGMTSKGSSASRRGDGIASRGKTRGKIC